MKDYNDPIYKRYPEMFFSRCPAFSHTPERFQDICVNGGSQKVLLNLLSNLSRDWYWYFCRQFELTSVSMAINFLPEEKTPVIRDKESKKLLFGDCAPWTSGKNPDKKLHLFQVRFNLRTCRANPMQVYFNTIPHEICHALQAHLYLNELEYLDHGKEFMEIIQYIGLEYETDGCAEIFDKVENLAELPAAELAYTFPGEQL